MSKRKTKWLSPAAAADAEQRRSATNEAVIAQLRSVYSDLFDDSVVRLVAQQCDFDVDAAIATLSAMVDDPSLIAAARRRQAELQPPPPPQQAALPSPASTGAWKAQPALLVNGASPAPRRPPTAHPQPQPQTSSLSSWPSPAEALPSKPSPRLDRGLGISPRNGEMRAVPASPGSVESLSPSPVPTRGAMAIRSAPTSPSSALQSTSLHRGVSASSTSSDISLSTAAVAPPPASASSQSSVRVVRDEVTQGFFDTRQGRLAAALSADQLQPRWSAYSASEEDPLYYLLMVREQHDKLRADVEEKRTAETVTDPASSSVDLQLDSFPTLSLHSPPDGHKMRVNAAELLELLRTMFDGVDEALIHSVVASLDCLSVDLHQLNECVTTLTAIAAADQLGSTAGPDDVSVDALFPPAGASSSSSPANGHLSDLEIAKRMASDPRYSPPRSAAARSLLSSSASTPTSSTGFGKKPAKVKVDLTKPVYKWAPITPTESVLSPHLSAKWSLDALYKAFPRLDRPLIDDCFAGHDFSWQKTKAQLLALFPGEMVGGEVAPLPSVLPIHDRDRRPGEAPRPKDDSDESVEGEGLIPDATLERELGPVLDNHSIPSLPPLAASPSTHANRRAAYFRAATEAFMAGKGGMAREYARRGKEEGEMMQAVGAEEAMRVFREANRDVDCAKRIDLHGQRVKEGVCILAFVVRRMRRRGVGEVLVVTGRGRNSAGGKSRLKPAVLSFCQRKRFSASMYNDAEIKVTWR